MSSVCVEGGGGPLHTSSTTNHYTVKNRNLQGSAVCSGVKHCID